MSLDIRRINKFLKEGFGKTSPMRVAPFIDALERCELEDVLTFEALRIVLKHPYARRQNHAECAHAASHFTLQEHLETALPFPRALDVFGHATFDKQYFELYSYKLLERAQEVGFSGAAGISGARAATAGSESSNAYTDVSATGQENTEG